MRTGVDARASEILALGLSIEHAGTREDVIVELPSGTTVERLADALSLHLPTLPPVIDLQVRRTGERLPLDAIVMDRDLRSGDTVLAVAARPRPRRRAARQRDASSVAVDNLGIALRPRIGAGDGVQLRRRGASSPPNHAPTALPSLVLERDPSIRSELGNGEWLVGGPDAFPDVVLAGLGNASLQVRAGNGTLAVRPGESPALVSVDGTVVPRGEWTTVHDGSVLRVGAAKLICRVPKTAAPSRADRLVVGDRLAEKPRLDLAVGGFVPVHRPPRRISNWRATTITLPETPRPQQRVRLPFVAATVPLIGGLLLALVFSPAMLALALLSPLMVLGTYVSDRRHREQEGAGTQQRFEQRLQRAHADMVEALRREVRERRAAAPPISELLRRAATLSPDLWERRPWDADFLALRLGVGDLPAETTVELRTSAEVEPDPRLAQLVAASTIVRQVPLVASLAELGVLGLAGQRVVSSDVARSLVLQSVTLHSPLELGVAAALAPGAEHGWDWLKWLPHAQTASGMLGESPLGTGRAALDVLRAVSERHERLRRTHRQSREDGREGDGPALLLVIDEALQLDRSLVAEILGQAAALRTVVIWIGGHPRSLPGECALTVDCSINGTARVASPRDGGSEQLIHVEGATIPQADAVVRALAPARDASRAAAGAEIPGRVRLLDQLELPTPTAAQLAERWQSRGRGLDAVIGVGAAGALAIDLRADGPHALIAGTTGAGKSELLRTIVASLAARHPPNRLTFLLIDYKGGAAFAPCAPLPHVLDVVSDLDLELGERALVSLRAEMTHREQLLADARADNLIDLERRSPAKAPPNLVIMVDEFAKLREEIPEFVDGVVDVAQRGRTLGIHMVLAAQSLRTAFTPAVRANTNLRIALRVTSDSESQDVIDAPDAARIPSGESRLGRGFARTGHERLLEFQTAHVSGRHAAGASGEVIVRAFPFEHLPVASTRRDPRESGPPRPDETDLAALAVAASGAAELLGLEPPRPAWTDPLPEVLSRRRVQQYTDVRAGCCAVGLVDEPSRQQQVPLLLRLDRGHVAAFGAAGTGKTTLLQTLVASMAWDASPEDLQIFAVDAGGGLGPIESLPHVAALLSGNDAERIERLLRRLQEEIATRTAAFARVGASTLTEYLDGASSQRYPRIVLIVDGLGEFAALHDTARPDSLFERLLAVLSGGRSVGIHVVATADRRGAVRNAVLASFPTRIVLRQTTPDDLVGFGIAPRIADRVTLSEGRAITDDDLIAQLAVPDPAVGAHDIADGFARLGQHLQASWPAARPATIDALPAFVSRAELDTAQPTLSALPIGVGGAHLGPLSIDLSERHFIVVGGYRTGRTTALAAIADGLSRLEQPPERVLLAPRRSALAALPGWDRVGRGVDAAADLARELATRVQQLPERDAPELVVMVDDGGELNDPAVLLALERLVRAGRDRGVRVVAAFETSSARMLSNLWARELRREGNGLHLAPDPFADGDLLGTELPRRSTIASAPGRGYLVALGRAEVIQIATHATHV